MIKPVNLAKLFVPVLLLVIISYALLAGGGELTGFREWLGQGKEEAVDNSFNLSDSASDYAGEKEVKENSMGIFLEEESYFPARIGEMTLAKALEGEEALKNIREYYGDEISISKAYIPYYQGNEQQAVIWISESTGKEEAEDLIKRIDGRIIERDVFYNYSSWEKKDTVIYHVEGMGWYSYYYQKENRVYWVCIQGEEPREIFNLIFRTL